MNILNLQVKIKKIKIKTSDNASISFSLRLGRVLSLISAPIVNQPNIVIEPDVTLTMGCDQSMINSNSRASLVIYQANQKQNKQIIGMVFISLKGIQDEVHRFRVQQTSDPHSFVQLSFALNSMDVKENQEKSLASKSSLAQIRQIHRVLSRDHRRSSSDISDEENAIKKTRISPQDRQKQLRSRGLTKIPHLKSQESPFGDDEDNDHDDPSYAILLKRTQSQLNKQKQRNSLLTNLLVIQQAKNNECQNFIKKVIKLTKISKQSKQNDTNNNNNNGNGYNMSITQQKTINQIKQIQSKLEASKSNKNLQKLTEANTPQTDLSNLVKIDNILKQRDQLYAISHDLFEKTKKFKLQNQNLFKTCRNLENQLKFSANQLAMSKQQNLQLQQKLYQLFSTTNPNLSKRPSENSHDNDSQNFQQKFHRLLEQNQNLKRQNIEYERKFKQSYKAIEQYKNDAWKAQEEVIIKEQEIVALREELQLLKNGDANKYQYQYQSCQFSGAGDIINPSEDKDKELVKNARDSFKFMASLIMKNNVERTKFMEILKNRQCQLDQNKIGERGLRQIEARGVRFIEKLKQKIKKAYQQYQQNKKKTITIFQMRKKFLQIINQTNF